ncbi:MAG: tRNA guanosine(34) transglycosylase Tgt, partial [Chloroflexi bacterium]|nr:tRNA guanosine(34) transglycosylase Tgt [Chloroflexota bacterium]
MSLSFTIEQACTNTAARAGTLQTLRGPVPTPVFMPVGTQATVKTLAPWDLTASGTRIILSNTYHLYLRPGAEVITDLGGLHQFMGWNGLILTDSGGYQVFSLGDRRCIEADGVMFRSHIDGSTHRFTPASVMHTQELLGADIVMAFDECAPTPCDHDYAQAAMERTHRWAEACLAAKTRPDQALFGIVQGSMYEDLRRESARFIAGLDTPGIAIGGLSVGEPKAVMWRMVEATVPELPATKPRYLMGVGSPEDLVEGVARGVDMFDCVLPTRIARNGALLTNTGRLNIRNAQYERDPRPIQEGCDCATCQHFSRAYLRHLFKAGEVLGLRLATDHNVRFLIRLMERIRAAILAGEFAAFRQSFLATYQPADAEARVR